MVLLEPDHYLSTTRLSSFHRAFLLPLVYNNCHSLEVWLLPQGPQQVIFSLSTIILSQTLSTKSGRWDTKGPGEDAGSAHLQQLGPSLELLPQVSHGPLHIEDRLLVLQELLSATVQGCVHILQVLDFPLKFRRRKFQLGHRGGGGGTSRASASHAA